MPTATPTLHLFCGHACSGKSTLAARLAAAPGTVLVSEDVWLHRLFGDEMTSVADYVRCVGKLRAALGPHISALLEAGVSVVLDSAANTVETRRWMRSLLDGTSASHRLHVMEASEEVCLARLRDRNARRDHPFSVTEAQFRQIAKHFVAPTEEEGFTIMRHAQVG